MKVFGRIVNVGVSLENGFGTHLEQGFAVIDTYQSEEAVPYAQLSHNVPWLNSPSRGFRATWHDMPPFCTYCHDASDAHIARECPKTRHFNSPNSSLYINIRLVSLNCNGLVKTNKPKIRSELVRFL